MARSRIVAALLSLVVLLFLLVSGCGEQSSAAAESQAAEVLGAALRASASPAASAAPGRLSADAEAVPLPQCLRTELGTALMAVVHTADARPTARPDGGETSRALARWMPPYFVHDVSPPAARERAQRGDPTGARAFLLGETPHATSIVGWVPADACLLLMRPISCQLTRGRLDVYASLDDVRDVLAAQAERRAPRARPFARSRPEAVAGIPWPIEVVEARVGERSVDVYRIHFLGAASSAFAGAPNEGSADDGPAGAAAERAPLSDEELQRVESQLRVQAMVVCDVTGSMQPYWEQVKSFLQGELARGLAELGVEVELGLVVFRDVEDAKQSFERRMFDLRTGVGDFVEELGRIEVTGGGDDPEATLRAIDLALARGSWSSSALTKRLMFVVSDAPAHENQGVSIAAVVERATSLGIRIHGLVVGNRGGAQRELQRRQYDQLATGSGGTSRDLEQIGELLEALRTELGSTRRDQADTRTVLRATNAGASEEEVARRYGLSIARVRSILEFLSDAGVGVPRSTEPRLACGYVLPASADHALEKRVITTRHAMRTLEFLLECVVQDYDPTTEYQRIGEFLVPALRCTRVVSQAEQPIDLYCRVRGIPLRKDGEILAISPLGIAQMAASERARRRSQLQNVVLPQITRILHDDQYWPFENSAGQWGFAPEHALP
ncbi:MAG: VWA domain-containing protein [Planctomycetes bacterium]|nr:VWA domain-containing protein [Planctomycetota bacterium]